MYTPFDPVILGDGETVSAGFVSQPDVDWREPILHLLGHKFAIWQWQMRELLSGVPEVDTRIYLLHRDGNPFTHIMTVAHQGVGMLCHVWTEPADRGKGAASALFSRALENFRAGGGNALFLSTGFESSAYRIYQRHGFQGIEPGSGIMAFYVDSKSEFEAKYFASGPVKIEQLNWAHWASSAALFTLDLRESVRHAGLGIWRRGLTEEPFLRALSLEQRGNAQTVVLRKTQNGAVVGVASNISHPWLPGTRAIDLFCHPNFEAEAGALLDRLNLDGDRRLAVADSAALAKVRLLTARGFVLQGELPGWLPYSREEADAANLQLYAKF